MTKIDTLFQSCSMDYDELKYYTLDEALFKNHNFVKTLNSFLFNYSKIQDRFEQSFFKKTLLELREINNENIPFRDVLTILEKLNILDIKTWDKLIKVKNTITYKHPLDIKDLKDALESFETLKQIDKKTKSILNKNKPTQKDEKTNYIAYTIGDIYGTILDSLQKDSKTKRLKAGSYFFSYFMKTLLKNIKDDFEILVPFVDNDILKQEHKNIGIFHDRFIASSTKSKDAIKDILKQKVQKTYEDIAKDKADILKTNMSNHFIVANEDELKSIDKNIIFALNRILDAKELQREFTFDIERSFIKEYQEEYIKKHKIKSIEDIKQDFNYYCVVVADGDKMGTKIKTLATDKPTNIKDISKKLFDFFTKDEDIYKTVNHKFGGELIYAGGDDILAILPVKQDDKTFLDFINGIDKKFKHIVGEDVSLSFGVNISYYKYPLRDAVENAFELLHKAKQNSTNTICIDITKHSGQTFGTTFKLFTNRYNLYKILLDDIVKQEVHLPHSIHHSLKNYQTPILETFKQKREINNLFETIFNDAKEEHKAGLEFLKEYLNEVSPKTEDEFNKLFSELSLVKFLREDRVWDTYLHLNH